MANTETDLNDYAELLYRTENFEQAFTVLERCAHESGMDGAFYIYIPLYTPRHPLDAVSTRKPAFNISPNLDLTCITDLFNSDFDPSKQPVGSSQFDTPTNSKIELIEWRKENCKNCRQKKYRTTGEPAISHGIVSGITIQLMSQEKGVAMAGFFRCHSQIDSENKQQVFDKLALCAKLFHSMVISSLRHLGYFLRPILNTFNDTEKYFLQKLAQGKTLTQIAHELGRNEKYLDKVMLRIRQKLSGVSSDEPPKINRNQVLYYAGLLNLFERKNFRDR